jgi:starch-binding outer membrane protein, SusD/RagB family
MTPILKTSSLVLLVGVLASGACNFDIANPNAPDPLGENPSRSAVAGAATGLLIGDRVDLADWVLDAAILGREAYRFDGSDPRFTGELLQGPLDPGGNAFGGDHWIEPYANIRSARALLAVVGTSQGLSAEEQSGVSGFARTIEALEFLNVVNGHTQDSIPLEVTPDVTAPPAPFRTHAEAMAEIVSLLDQAQVELAAGGAAFPFTLPNGFSGFNTPATFAKFNRALRARVAVYLNDWAGALTALSQSFLDPAAAFSVGVYIDHGTGPGDFANPLAQNPTVGENFAHPTLETDAQLQPGGLPDQRFLDKVIQRPERSVGSGAGQLSSHLGWIRYATPITPIPLIRNEELILLRAEANIGLNNLAAATDDINLVRTTAGRLAPIGVPATPETALDALLYEKRYSLLYEGGHRWIDMRHYGRLAQLPIDRPANTPPDVVFSTLPIPTAEVLPRQ